MIHFSKFRKSYGSFLALKIDNSKVEPGIYWIKGINGSGKSTLLKVMAGVLYFDGDILLNNSLSIKKHPLAYRKWINFAEAEPIYPEFLTGKEMVDLFCAAKRASSAQVDFYTESMEMKAYIQQPVSTYSSGMLKKLSLVLAFLGSPKIILLDEQLVTLDAGSLKILYHWISEKHHKHETSFFLTSHQNLEHEELPEAKTLLVEEQTLKFDC